jgi:hypothetical protein
MKDKPSEQKAESCLMLVYYSAFFSTLITEAAHSSELQANSYWTTGHHIPEDSTLHVNSC